MDRSRLEAFSDGVFAVAITLLALDLTVAGPGGGHGSLSDQLYHRWPAFLAYLVSFFMIGIIWVNHHVLVRSIRTVDRLLLFLNLVLLLFVVLIPFATATVSDYLVKHDWDANVATALHGRRVYQPLPPDRRWAARARFAGGGLVYLVAIVVALFSAAAAFALIALVAVYYVVERTPAPAVPGDGEGQPAEIRDDQ
jgi:hypothetical protein